EVQHRDGWDRPCKHLADCPPGQEEGEQAKISTTTHRRVHAQKAERDRRQLEDGVVVASGKERRTWGIGHAVAIMPDRVDGRLVEEPLLREDVQSPGRSTDDAERRGTVAQDGLT